VVDAHDENSRVMVVVFLCRIPL